VSVDIERKLHRTGAFPHTSPKLSEGTKEFFLWLFYNMVSSFPGNHLSRGFVGFIWVLVLSRFFFALVLPDAICPSTVRYISEKGKEEGDAGSSI